MTETTPQRSALITGAAVRVGAAMARALAADGWHVAINYDSDKPQIVVRTDANQIAFFEFIVF